LKPGDPVNIETDIVAKYLEKWMRKDQPLKEELNVEALTAKGF
jgi:riboflavin synthase alpha subunit